MAGSKRGNGQQRTETKHAGPKAAKHGRRSRANVDGGSPPSEENDALPAALTFDVDASREPAEPNGIGDDYARIDGEFPEDVDEPDAVDGRRTR
jgi:hypothetical protein